MNINTLALLPLQEVAIERSWGGVNFGYMVIKVTPKGQVVVKRFGDVDAKEYRFDKEGYAMDGSTSSYHKDRLIVDVAGARNVIERKARATKAAVAIEAVRVERCLSTYPQETMARQIAELEEKLTAAKLLVAAI